MNSLFGYLSFILSILALVLFVNACTEEEPELTNENRSLSDSIIRVQTSMIIDEVDSLCKLSYQQNFNQAVDSISKIRLQEIEKYIPNK